jgi:hypothetical protein
MNMKVNWKIIIALVLVVGGIYFAVNSTVLRSYNGSNLNFGIGSGPVTVTNPSEEALPVQLVGSGTRTFSVSSTVEDVSGRSARVGTTQVFEFALPPGLSEFTVVSGSEVNFVSSADTRLEATVQPLKTADSQTTLIAAVVVILGALFYISRTNGHRWISASRRKSAVDLAAAQEIEKQTFDRIIMGRGSSNKP